MQASLGVTTYKFLTVPEVNSLIRDLDAAFTAGMFRVRAQQPQPIHMLRQASYHELEMRRRYIARRREHGYHTEQINIRKVKKEIIRRRYEQDLAEWMALSDEERYAVSCRMLQAAHAQQEGAGVK